MKRNIPNIFIALAAAALFCITFAPRARSLQASPQQTVSVTITARASGKAAAPALTAKDVTVHEDNQPRPVVSVTPAHNAESPMQFAILVDSNSSPRVAAQYPEVSRFLQNLPPKSSIAVAYGSHGAAEIEQPFTTDRAAVQKALHAPFGPPSGSSGIYEALSDLIHKWPANGSALREVLLISSGIDSTYGAQIQPSQNSGLQAAIRDAQRQNIAVFSIFVTSGRETRNTFLNLNGQGSLNELTRQTGGYFFSQGTRMPVSFRPFLDEIQKMLAGQYVLTFEASPSSSAGLHNFKVNTEVSGVKLLAPQKVFVPASK